MSPKEVSKEVYVCTPPFLKTKRGNNKFKGKKMNNRKLTIEKQLYTFILAFMGNFGILANLIFETTETDRNLNIMLFSSNEFINV